jgi:hypothetical protein
MNFERHTLTREGMVEVEKERLRPDFLHHAGIGSGSVGSGKPHHVTNFVALFGFAQFTQEIETHMLQQVGVALAERHARLEFKPRAFTFGQTNEARLDGRSQFTLSEGQSRRFVVKRVEKHPAPRPAEAIVQGQKRAGDNVVQGKGRLWLDCAILVGPPRTISGVGAAAS